VREGEEEGDGEEGEGEEGEGLNGLLDRIEPRKHSAETGPLGPTMLCPNLWSQMKDQLALRSHRSSIIHVPYPMAA